MTGLARLLDLRPLLLDDEGRIPRRLFWLYVLGAIVFVTAFMLIMPLIGVPARYVPLAASLIMIFPTYCIIAKRLHDADIDSIWAILISGIAAIDALFVAAGPQAALTGIVALLRSLWWWIALANMFAFLLIGLLPGTRGPNRFGPERV